MKKHYKKVSGCSQSTFQAHLAELCGEITSVLKEVNVPISMKRFSNNLLKFVIWLENSILITLTTSFPILIQTRVIPSHIDIQRRLSEKDMQSDIDDDEDDVL